MEYIGHVAIMVTIYVMLTVSLNLLLGHTGLLSIAQAAFFGIGAYTAAVLTIRSGAPFIISVLAGMSFGGLTSFLVSLPSSRLHDDYFAIATFAFQMIVFSVFNNWMDVTRGPLGIYGIPQPTIFGCKVDSHLGFLILAVGFTVFTYLVVSLLASSPFGRVLHAIREDEVFARAHGKNTLYFKVMVFAVSAALAAAAGSFYAHYITYIDPTSFTVMESILIISMVIIGGAGSLWGPLVGAFVLVTLPEALRFAGLPSTSAANLRQVIYGTLLIIMMMFRPRGLMGKYGFAK